jgi:hypothetical protein
LFILFSNSKYYLRIINVTTHSQAVEDAPSVIISIVPSDSTLYKAVGSDVSTSPAADPDWVIVIAESVIATPPISQVNAASADVIAFLIEVIILITLPPSGIGTKVDPAVLIVVIFAVSFNVKINARGADFLDYPPYTVKYYEVVTSVTSPLAASFLDSRVYSATKNL